MTDVLQQLMSQLGPSGIQAISNQIGANEKETTNALGGMIPTLLGAMANNAKSTSGAQGLLGALDADHDGSILDDVVGFVTKSGGNNAGQGILNHILGGQQPTVEQGLSAKTGLSSSQISNLLKIAAPLILGYLGKQKREQPQAGFDTGGIASLLGGMTKQADQSTGLDIGDLLQVVGGLSGNSGANSASGIGGLLGKLFKR